MGVAESVGIPKTIPAYGILAKENSVCDELFLHSSAVLWVDIHLLRQVERRNLPKELVSQH